MKVQQDWDLPCKHNGANSYYPPLRFPGLREESPDKGRFSAALPGSYQGRPAAVDGPISNGGRSALDGPSFGGSGTMQNGSSLPSRSSALNGPAFSESSAVVGSSMTNGFTSASGGGSHELSFSNGGGLQNGFSPDRHSNGSAHASNGQASSGASSAAFGGMASAADVEVRGSGQIPGPWKSWEEVAFPPRVKAPLVSAGFPAPSSIQQYAWPILTAGRDLIGIAKTGSGKTLAFLLPIFAQLLESKADLRGPPAALVMAPTRELAVQIENEAKRFGSTACMRAACLYGGAPKGPQLAELRQRPQVLVATPGRLNDLLDPPAGLSVAVDVKSVRYLVLDEADRMLDMGFEPQIRKIIAGLPQERQTAMFTATWPIGVRRLASEFQKEPAEVRIGEAEFLSVNPDITQHVLFCMDMREKEERLEGILRDSGGDQAIVFVNTKRMCEMVSLRLSNSVAIHGDKDQRERDLALGQFKSGATRVLVATDVAARGLDVKAVKVVVNFDPPNREEDYVHRVGRTGRAGQKGSAWTLLTNEDGAAARSIVDIFKRMDLPVPSELERRLASGEMRSSGRSGAGSRSRSVSRRPLGMPGDDDFDFGGDRTFGGRGRDDDFPRASFVNDCPTW